MTGKTLEELLAQGARLYADGNSPGAARVYREAMKLAPDDPTVRLRHATAIWHGEDRADEALSEVRDLARDFPQAVVFATEGLILNSLGQFEQAATAARKALRADPGHSSAWLDLATATPAKDAAPLIDELRTELQVPGGPPKARRDMHFALARLLRKMGDHDAAFVETVHGNNLQPQRWNAEQESAFRNLLRETFTPERMEALADTGAPGPDMVFVMGMPRSGTTLTERMLLAHDQIASIGESKAVGNLFMQLRQACTRSGAAVGDALRPDMLRQIGQAVIQAARARIGPGPARIIDKMPANTLFVPFIRLILPQARIIHVRRHPLDTCLSCYEASFAFGLDYAARQASLAEAYRMYADLMDHWAKLPGVGLVEIAYEDLVRTPEPVLRQVLDDLGLPWDTACLNPAVDGAIKTASVDQARNAAHTGSIGRWLRHVRDLQPLIEKLGGMDWIETRTGP